MLLDRNDHTGKLGRFMANNNNDFNDSSSNNNNNNGIRHGGGGGGGGGLTGRMRRLVGRMTV